MTEPHLNTGTVDNTDSVPTVPDNLLSQGTITQEVVGIFYAPTTSDSDKNGELTFGGTDSSKFTGTVSFTPITTTSPASEFWGIDQVASLPITFSSPNSSNRIFQEITYANGSSVLAQTAGIVDTGTTLVLLATDAFNTYMQLTGATLDQTTGLLTISQADYANLQSLMFNVGGTNLEFTADGQVRTMSYL